MKLEAVRRAKKHYAASIPSDVEVVGVGIGLSGNDPVLKVNIRTAPADKGRLPDTIEGVPVVYEVVGKIVAQ